MNDIGDVMGWDGMGCDSNTIIVILTEILLPRSSAGRGSAAASPL